jgi:hypothetical protein
MRKKKEDSALCCALARKATLVAIIFLVRLCMLFGGVCAFIESDNSRHTDKLTWSGKEKNKSEHPLQKCAITIKGTYLLT